jgi:NADH-quinone oxidoreductase subunit F
MFQQALNGEKLLNGELLSDLLDTMEHGSLCALGGGLPLPIKNALQYFPDELNTYFDNNHPMQRIASVEV